MNSVLLGFLGIGSPLLIIVGLILIEATGNDGYLIVILAGAVSYLWRATARGIARDFPRHLAAKDSLIAGCVVATVGAIMVSIGIEANSLATAGSQILFVGLAIFVFGVSVYVLSLVVASPDAKP